jgi:hypothetical protein
MLLTAQGGNVERGTMAAVTSTSDGSTFARRRRSVLLVLGLALACPMGLARAQQTPQPAADTPEAAASRARSVLEKHCAACHQAEQTGTKTAGRELDNILRLDELARDPNLVVPGFADASGLYHVLLRRHRPQDVYAAANGDTGPGGDEIEAVRAWIEGLEERAASCPERPPVPAGEVETLASAWLKAAGQGAAGIRFISLAHLSNACVRDSTIAAYREALPLALAALAGRDGTVRAETLGDMSAVVAFALADAGLTAEAWEAIARRDPAGSVRTAAADWLVAEAYRTSGAAALAALAGEYNRPLGIRRAAAELDTTAEALRKRLEAVEGAESTSARRLLQGLLPRLAWEGLSRTLAGKPSLAAGAERTAGAAPAASPGLRLSLVSDKVRYRAGDLVTLSATASDACHLTLIGIDKAGMATVLLPNDFERKAHLERNVTRVVPAPGAGYQLRVKEPGAETVVGICSEVAPSPDGITHDWVRQRFTALGNWRSFLKSSIDRRNGAGRSRTGAAARESRTAIAISIE